MFDSQRYIQNSFNVVFPRQPSIRRLANEFEDKLKCSYAQPQIVPIPDDLDPEVPRMIFGSQHGYSQIIVSQISIALSVTYSPDWQEDISKGQRYLLDKVSTIFDLLSLLDQVKPCFSGLTTRVNLSSQQNDKQIVKRLTDAFLRNSEFDDLDEIQVKIARITEARFYSNITIHNYRTWKFEAPPQGPVRYSRGKSVERGIQVIGDFNDRHRFNEDENYYSSLHASEQIINSALMEVAQTVEKLRG